MIEPKELTAERLAEIAHDYLNKSAGLADVDIDDLLLHIAFLTAKLADAELCLRGAEAEWHDRKKYHGTAPIYWTNRGWFVGESLSGPTLRDAFRAVGELLGKDESCQP